MESVTVFPATSVFRNPEKSPFRMEKHKSRTPKRLILVKLDPDELQEILKNWNFSRVTLKDRFF
jgi:hypothetical protein